MKLRESIEALVDRAAKLRPEPEAITIQKHGIAGSEAAKKCFEALEKCRNGQSKIASIDWEEYREILKPRKGESSEAKAAQIVIDWPRWKPGSITRSGPLEFWLSMIGNRDLLSKLVNPDLVNPFETILADRKENKRKQGNSIRQKRHRLLTKKYELVRQELEIIDSPNSTQNEREAAAKRLIHYTGRTADEWGKIFVKKA